MGTRNYEWGTTTDLVPQQIFADCANISEIKRLRFSRVHRKKLSWAFIVVCTICSDILRVKISGIPTTKPLPHLVARDNKIITVTTPQPLSAIGYANRLLVCSGGTQSRILELNMSIAHPWLEYLCNYDGFVSHCYHLLCRFIKMSGERFFINCIPKIH